MLMCLLAQRELCLHEPLSHLQWLYMSRRILIITRPVEHARLLRIALRREKRVWSALAVISRPYPEKRGR